MVIKKQNNTLEFQWPASSTGAIFEGMEITDHILRKKKRERAAMMKELSCKNKWIFFGGWGSLSHTACGILVP